MKITQDIMGMPIIVEIAENTSPKLFDRVFDYFTYVDEVFSTYKKTSEITKINNGEVAPEDYSSDMKIVLRLCEKTKEETLGYFNCMKSGVCDPSGIVKGWAIFNAAKILDKEKVRNFYINAGGDIETRGKNVKGKKWRVGIKNPFNPDSLIKVVYLENCGIATSATYERGMHIYNPHTGLPADEIASMTVIGKNVYEADRFATAAFAMGNSGIEFIARHAGLEGYMIKKDGLAVYTPGFEKYV